MQYMCDKCVHNPPSSSDGKPCCACDPYSEYQNCFQDAKPSTAHAVARQSVHDVFDKYADTESPEYQESYRYYDILGQFSIALVDYRITHGLSQQQLAERLNISKKKVCRYEEGTRNISIKTLNRICQILELGLYVRIDFNVEVVKDQ